MAGRWNPSLHPRSPKTGKFVNKIGGSFYAGRGGRYHGVKISREYAVGRRGQFGDVLVKGIVGYAPPGSRTSSGRKVSRQSAVPKARRTSRARPKAMQDHIRAVATMSSPSKQRSYLDQLSSFALRQMIGQLPGPLQYIANKILLKREQRR